MNKTIAFAALILAGNVAFAAAPAFEDVDTNGDGVLSQEEAAAVEGLDFTAADTDQNGSLSKDEYEAATSE